MTSAPDSRCAHACCAGCIASRWRLLDSDGPDRQRYPMDQVLGTAEVSCFSIG